MSQSLIAALGFVGGVLVALVDGTRAVSIAAVAAGLSLAPAAASVGGWPGALLGVLAAAATVAAAAGAWRLAQGLRTLPGLDPQVPVVAPRDHLFGPRSIRALGAATALLGASWVSLNVDVGGAASDRGAVFAAAYVWLSGAVRLLRGRALEDFAVATVAVGFAGAVTWLLEAGSQALPEAASLAGLGPLAGATVGWLAGRHQRGPSAGTAGEPG